MGTSCASEIRDPRFGILNTEFVRSDRTPASTLPAITVSPTPARDWCTTPCRNPPRRGKSAPCAASACDITKLSGSIRHKTIGATYRATHFTQTPTLLDLSERAPSPVNRYIMPVYRNIIVQYSILYYSTRIVYYIIFKYSSRNSGAAAHREALGAEASGRREPVGRLAELQGSKGRAAKAVQAAKAAKAAMWQPCGSHAAAMRQPCGSHVAAMWQPCGSPVAAMWQPCGSQGSPGGSSAASQDSLGGDLAARQPLGSRAAAPHSRAALWSGLAEAERTSGGHEQEARAHLGIA